MSELSSLTWWRLACRVAPWPIAFVADNDYFLFANPEWCQLVGYAESELQEKRWQDITLTEDIGGDQQQTEKLKDPRQEATEYYEEKTYVRKDGEQVYISLFVHRVPTYGNHLGYVVFARPHDERAVQEMKREFSTMQEAVGKLQQGVLDVDQLKSQLAEHKQEVDRLWQLTGAALGGGRQEVNFGDQTGGDKIGRDKNSAVPMIVIAIVIGLLTAVLIVGLTGGRLELQRGTDRVQLEGRE